MNRKKIAIAGVAVALGTWLGWAGYQSSLEHRIEQEYQLAADAGIPTRPEDLQQKRVFPNAAHLYRQASDGILSLSPDDRKAWNSAINLESKAKAADREKALKRFSAILSTFDTAAKMEDCFFGRDYRHGYNLLLPEYATMLQAVNAKVTLADAARDRGERRAALVHLTDAARIARHVASDDGELATSVRSRAEAAIVPRLMALRPDPPEATAALRALGPVPNPRRDLGVELVFFRVSRPIAQQYGGWSRLFTDFGMKSEDLDTRPLQDTLHDMGITRASVDLETVRALRAAAESVPERPRSREDFAAYLDARKLLPNVGSMVRNVYRFRAMLSEYPEAYFSLVNHRERLRAISNAAAGTRPTE
ncbi:MAG: hypothetical protein SFX74_06645 [Fimbriimonadaceae bacterium]|nr:hypothetical protein [Fimbriimonadaceae bacterium]